MLLVLLHGQRPCLEVDSTARHIYHKVHIGLDCSLGDIILKSLQHLSLDSLFTINARQFCQALSLNARETGIYFLVICLL